MSSLYTKLLMYILIQPNIPVFNILTTIIYGESWEFPPPPAAVDFEVHYRLLLYQLAEMFRSPGV